MSDHIRVTCEHCNHAIKAPRDAAGRRGKCPNCHNSVYIPTPESELEEIPLELEDEPTHAEAQRLEKESAEVAAALRRETNEAPQSTSPQPTAIPREDRPAPRETALNATEIDELIIRYLLAMQVSELERAEALTAKLQGAARQAKSKIQQMMVDSMRPESVRSMADGLYQGFLRKLLEQL